ncbi:MAG: hypothetical protein HC887_08680 [Desulfobacteraceae bacterium]|nr:hypothetical protein [Desulfobacteraceae bacterium]
MKIKLTAISFFICIALGVSSAYAELKISEAWKIAFVRGKDIWIADGDGTNQKRIIRNGRSPC